MSSVAPAPTPYYKRKAVVVGINYVSCGEIALNGCANDAYAFAMTLINLWHFDPRDILLLTDDLSVYAPPPADSQTAAALMQLQLPYRSNILSGLKWLVSGSQPGDVLVFYFAGHGIQLDNLSGWEGEGFDEAILPLDCTHQQGDVNAISAVCLRSHFLSVSDRIQLSIFLDCAGCQTALDVSGLGKWNFIRGVMQKGLWPLTDPTDKMRRARFDSNVWTSPIMRARHVRPRYVPGIEVNNTLELADVQSKYKRGGGEKTHAYMFAGAPFSEVPVEGLCPALRIPACSPTGRIGRESLTTKKSLAYHGAFTWALIRALVDQAKDNPARQTTFSDLQSSILCYIQQLIKRHGLPKINQQPSLTCYMASGSSPKTDFIFHPFGGRVKGISYHQGTRASTLTKANLLQLRQYHPSQLLNVSHLDSAMRGISNRTRTQVVMRKRTQALEEAWRSPVARSTIM